MISPNPDSDSQSNTPSYKFGSTDIFRLTPGDNGLTTRLVSNVYLWTCIFITASLYISPTQLPEDEEAAFGCPGEGQGYLAS